MSTTSPMQQVTPEQWRAAVDAIRAAVEAMRSVLIDQSRSRGGPAADERVASLLRADDLTVLRMFFTWCYPFAVQFMGILLADETTGKLHPEIRKILMEMTDEHLARFVADATEELKRRGAPKKRCNDRAYELYVPALKAARESGITDHERASKLAWKQVWADPEMKRYVYDAGTRRTHKMRCIRDAVLKRVKSEEALERRQVTS